MNGKNLLEGRTGPITQSIDAIKSLLAYVGRASDLLPTDVSLENGRLVLVLSNKKDVYYTTTTKACSCPSATYHGGRCKHQRKYFPEPQKSREELEAEGANVLAANNSGPRRLARPPEESSIRPAGKWPGGLNGPVDSIPGEEKARAASASMLIDCHDTTALDVAYHSIQEDKILWPACEA